MRVEHWALRQNVRQHKAVLHRVADLLTTEIRKRATSNRPYHLDFRYVLPLAQWLVEQDGYTMTPAGNNPGNVMGKGDAGVFHRPNNTEIVGGARVNVPADFANYSSLPTGTAATFDHLQKRWPSTYSAMLTGGSPAAYVAGLYPGRGKDYATLPQSEYLSGLRVRIRHMIIDYRMVFQDDIQEAEQRVPALQAMLVRPGADPSLAPEIESRVAGNQRAKGTLSAMLDELGEVEKRFQAGQALAPEPERPSTQATPWARNMAFKA